MSNYEDFNLDLNKVSSKKKGKGKGWTTILYTPDIYNASKKLCTKTYKKGKGCNGTYTKIGPCNRTYVKREDI